MKHDPRIEVTVELSIDNGTLHRHYRAATGHWDGPADPVDAIAIRGEQGEVISLPMLLDWLHPRGSARATAGVLEEKLTGPAQEVAGQVLFAVLFGRDRRASTRERSPVQIMCDKVYGEPQKTPLFRELRVRVWVSPDGESSGLRGLPWMATRWSGHLLIDKGWTFESWPSDPTDEPLALRAPPKVLVLAPERGKAEPDDLGTRKHILALRDIWEGVWPRWTRTQGHFEVASSLEEARQIMEERALPEVVYYYGHGTLEHGRSYLAISDGGDSRIDVGDLLVHLPALNRHRPSILFLNACFVGRAGWGSAGHQLGQAIALVLAHAMPVRGGAAQKLAERFWTAVVRDRVDPVIAVHDRSSGGVDHLGVRATNRQFLDLAPAVVTSSYSRAHFQRPPGIAGYEAIRKAFDLDRSKQRAHFRDKLEDTLRSGAKVHLVIAHGGPGNLMEKAPDQLLEYLLSKKLERELHIHKVALRKGVEDRLKGAQDEPSPGETPEPPFDRLALEAALLVEAARTSGARPMTLEPAVRSLCRSRLGDALPVVWLDAGHIRADSGPTRERVELFRRFLCEAVPPEADLFVIGSLAIEVSEASAASTKKMLADVAKNMGYREKLRVNVLDPFEEPPYEEIIDYLEKAGCDAAIRHDLASALLEPPGGSYEAVVRHLDGCRTAADYVTLLRKLSPASSKRGTL